MRRLFLIGCLILVAFASAATQTSVTGRWRAVLLTPDGGTQNISLELDAKGETVTGNLEGLAIREGRLDGSTLTLKLSAPNNQEVSLIGQVSGDEIVFKSTGLPAGPIQFVARRDLRGAVSRKRVGSIGRPAADEAVQCAWRQHRRHQGLQDRGDVRLRRRRRRDRRAGDDGDDVSGGVDQQAGGGDGVAEGGAERTVLAGPGRQHDLEVMEAAGWAVHEGASRHPAKPDEPHVGNGRWIRIPRLRATGAAAVDPADPRRRPAAVESQGRSAGARAARPASSIRVARC